MNINYLDADACKEGKMTKLFIDGKKMWLTDFMATPGLHVAGSLNLAGCTSLTKLPDGLRVGGSVDLRGCTSLRNIVRGGIDGRGYEFFGIHLRSGQRVIAGCRNFSPAEARKHWPEGSECRALAEDVIARLEAMK